MPKQEQPKTKQHSTHAFREYAEAIGVALILAFIFKAFVIEAYSIPTGSMAATLMGRHKDVACEVCGYPFQLGASEESAKQRVVSGTCPQCNFTMYVGEDNTAGKTYMSYNGDRIFVDKDVFNFRQPQRFHVTVFRYPANPYMNYIKRLVGLENETVRIQHGDLFVKKDGETDFSIQRKPLRALKAMLRPVNDNNYVYPPIHKLGYPTSWHGGNGWRSSEDYKSFFYQPQTAEALTWLTFRNISPSKTEYEQLLQGTMPSRMDDCGKPVLITDFLAYNSELVGYNGLKPAGMPIADVNGKKLQMPAQNGRGMGLNWVGDLAVSCRMTANSSDPSRQPTFNFRLVKGGIEFLCAIDLHTGQATLSIPDVPEFKPVNVDTPVRDDNRNYTIQFMNIDEELRLVVNGAEIDTFHQGRYDGLCKDGTVLSRDRSPTEKDLQPAAIGMSGACSVSVSNLKVERDLYYISCQDMSDDTQCDLIRSPFHRAGMFPWDEDAVRNVLMSPEYWSTFGKTRTTEFKLGKDQFLMLGDNSAKSKDGRLWTGDGIPYYVDRKFLIGEAVIVYWGHGLRIPGTRIAIIPNIPKMRWID